jgi:hypothetical protein
MNIFNFLFYSKKKRVKTHSWDKTPCILVRVVEVLHYLNGDHEKMVLVNDVVTKDVFTVWASKIIIKKSRGKEILIIAQEIN